MTENERIALISADTLLTAEEQAKFIEGVPILCGLGWPAEIINYTMAQRAIDGLVPKYEDVTSLYAYRATWAKEDNAADLKRRLANDLAREAAK
jgi:hypothetical protein